MEDIVALALLAIGVYVGYKILTKISGWLVNWARTALRGFGTGLLALARKLGEIWAFAISLNQSPDVVEEIEVDESQLSEEVLQALRRHGAVVERISV
jgi:hypothetical protein